jgi:hypothetical protein
VTPREFRSSIAWKRARANARRNATVCEICGGELRRDLGPRHKLAPSVDHVEPLARLNLNSSADRALAVSQNMLRVTHLGCNARRGAGQRQRRVPRLTSRKW